MSSSTDYGDGNFSISLGSFHRPISVRYNWSVFARKMHSTSEFAKIVLSKCVCVSSVLLVRSHAFHFCPPLFHAKNINLLDVKRNLAEPLRSARPIRVLDCRAAKWMWRLRWIEITCSSPRATSSPSALAEPSG